MNFNKILQFFEGELLKFKRDIYALEKITKTFVDFRDTTSGNITVGRADNVAHRLLAWGHRKQDRVLIMTAFSHPEAFE